MLNRRDALKRLGAFAGAATLAPRFLTGCDDPGEAGITHFVLVTMENRSYDHYLGARALEGLGGNGLIAGMANQRMDGTSVDVFKASTPCVDDPPHSWTRAHAQWNGGQMDGFLREYEDDEGEGIDPHVMGYFARPDIPVTWALADEFTTCDHWFAGILGPTWPNRLFLYAGESGGMISNNRAEVQSLTLDTILHRLKAKGVGVRYYFTDAPFAPLIRGITSDMVSPLYNFYDDAEKGTLPQVTYIDPGFSGNDDHPPHHPILGQQFLGSIYAALANSPQWENMLIVFTYDENGGFYDHVAPPTIADAREADGFGQLGFRVPTLVLGPYAKRGYVSPVVYNHASVVRHLEKMFGLDSITARVAASPDLSDTIDMARLAAGDARPAPMTPAVTVDMSMIGEECSNVNFKHPSDIELVADTGFFGDLDRRRYKMDDIEMIASVLRRYGVGGIRKNF